MKKGATLDHNILSFRDVVFADGSLLKDTFQKCDISIRHTLWKVDNCLIPALKSTTLEAGGQLFSGILKLRETVNLPQVDESRLLGVVLKGFLRAG